MAHRVLTPGRWPVTAVLALAAFALQLWGLYRVTGPPSPGWFPAADKAEHLIGFAAPVLLFLLTVELGARHRTGRPAGRGAVLAIVSGFAAHGVVSEVVQHVAYRTRTGDPLDTVADWAGVAVGWAVFAGLVRRHRLGAGARTPGSGARRVRG